MIALRALVISLMFAGVLTAGGCDFIYGLLQKEGAEEKDNLGAIIPMEPNEQVRRVQSLLKVYGYSVGQPDGVLGTNTRVAIAKFQEDNGLKVTRFVDHATMGRLLFHEDIGLIKDGEIDVLVMQQALKDAGFNPGPIDGKAGNRTWDALKAFQNAKGLKADGRPGLKTLRELAVYVIK